MLTPLQRWVGLAAAAVGSLALLVLLLPRSPDIGALVERPDVEQCLLAAAADERAKAGVPPLEVDGRLVNGARRHASEMAGDGELRHSNLRDTYGSGWKLVGENVAMNADTTSCVPMAKRLAASAGHRANTIDGRWSFSGAGVVEVDALLWAAIAFAQTHGTVPPVAATTIPAPPSTRPPPPPILRPPCTCPAP